MPRRPTSADVATEAGVSRTTVSFVLNGRTDVKIPTDTRTRVLEAAERLGYHPHAPARQLAGGRSHILALVLRQTAEQVADRRGPGRDLRGLATAARGRRLPGHGRTARVRTAPTRATPACCEPSTPTAS